jgi:hypothetical protein
MKLITLNLSASTSFGSLQKTLAKPAPTYLSMPSGLNANVHCLQKSVERAARTAVVKKACFVPPTAKELQDRLAPLKVCSLQGTLETPAPLCLLGAMKRRAE